MMTAKWFARPELNSLRHDAKTRPEWWARDFSDSESQSGFGHFGFQLEIALHRLRLFGRPRADLAQPRPCRKICVSFFVTYYFGAPAHADLLVERHPIKAERCARIAQQRLRFRTLHVCEKNKSALVHAFQ